MVILCSRCTLLYPGRQRKPMKNEQCEVCGNRTALEQETLLREAIASSKLDGETITIDDGKPPHKPPIAKLLWVGVDLDGTLAAPIWTPDNPTSEIGDPIWQNVRKIKELVDAGYKIIIHTSRPWTDYQNIEHWLKYYKIPFKEIQCGKPLYAAYIDDRAIHAEDLSWLPRGH